MKTLKLLAALATIFCLLSKAKGYSIAKRSDDSDPLIPVVERLNADVTELKAQVAVLQKHVAFTAQFSSSQANIPSGIFKFDKVIFNDGNAYDPTLGIFKAPFPGVYMFSLQIFAYGPQRLLASIHHNQLLVHRMAMDTTLLGSSQNGEDSNSLTFNLKLEQGDRVWVEGSSSLGQAAIWGTVHTFLQVLSYTQFKCSSDSSPLPTTTPTFSLFFNDISNNGLVLGTFNCTVIKKHVSQKPKTLVGLG